MRTHQFTAWRRSAPLARTLACGLLALSLLIGPCHATGATTIDWRVENPFRLFIDPVDTARHRAIYDRLALDEKFAPILAAERVLSALSPHGWAEAVIDKTCWSAREQRYRCDAGAAYAHPISHRVLAALAWGRDSAGPCAWTVRSIGMSMAASAVLTAPCNEPVRLDIPYPGGARVEVAQNGVELSTAVIKVADLFIVGLGDSYAAGDGNPDVPIRFDDRRSIAYKGDQRHGLLGYPARAGSWSAINDIGFDRNAARWLSEPCHRSLYSHQLRVALQLAIEEPHRAVTFAGFACWGSDIVGGLLLPMAPHELVPHMPRISQLSAAAAIQCGNQRAQRMEWTHAFDQGGRILQLTNLQGLRCSPEEARKIDLLLVTVGGNDIGFAQLVANAVLSDATPLRQIGGLLGQVISAPKALAAIDALADRFKALNRAAHLILHIPWEQSDRIVLTAYPPIALQEDLAEACPSGRQGMTVIPGFELDQGRARDSERVGNRLHLAMQSIAKASGWSFVDAHRAQFRRHGLCAGSLGSLAAPADDVRLPRLVDGDWRPYRPSQWEPYASRRRWIRTPNDGYMTVNFHVARIADTPVNLILASSYSGAFHPTAEGQAAIADAVADRARRIIEKYRNSRK